ncbi:MAG: F0F1 ATP synthase subunit epsilon [Desulfuromonadaceae bacterium]|nr:F0F1 ATP synthase subunit epsilon [Desulfuromonas sp.]MDY0185493.1 F0F1 ATP synthase subunit epsilon [Desulfuromonadaceae bacterium]
MELQVVLPTRIFLQQNNLSHMSIDTLGGNLGFLPRRLDCVVPVSPGILAYRLTDTDAEEYIAVDTGILIKTGAKIVVSVHHAVASASLAELEQIIHAEFEQLSEQEKLVRSISAGIETKLIRRFIELRRDY